MNKRGVYFFIIDVIIAVLIFLTTVLVISNFFVLKPSLGGIDQNLDILTKDFFTLPVANLSNDVLASVPEVYQKRSDLTVDELLYLLQSQNPTYNPNITEIIKSLISWLPSQYGFNYSLIQANADLYYRPTSLNVAYNDADVVVSRMKVTGINSKDSKGTLIPPSLTEVTIWR